MSEKHENSPGAAAGVPQSDPPGQGEGIDPAEVAPGFGGTAQTSPQSEDDEAE